jgi:hypothetical protein
MSYLQPGVQPGRSLEGGRTPSAGVTCWPIAGARAVVFATPTCNSCVCGLPRPGEAVRDLLEASTSWLRQHPDESPIGVAIDSNPADATSAVILTLEPTGD